MKKIVFILTFLFSAIATFAQKVELCIEYNKTTGIPYSTNTNWNIKPDGSYIYILYTQERPITKELAVYIDKKNKNGEYIAFDTKFISTEEINRQKWAVLQQIFKQAGDYKITILEGGTELASTYTKIDYQKGFEPNDDNSEIDTYYYENSEVSIAEDVDETTFNVKNKLESEYLYNTKNKGLYIVVENDKNFKTTKFYVDIELNGEFLKTVEMDVQENWDIAWIKNIFDKKGKYIIDVYNGNDIFVNTTTFEVK